MYISNKKGQRSIDSCNLTSYVVLVVASLQIQRRKEVTIISASNPVRDHPLTLPSPFPSAWSLLQQIIVGIDPFSVILGSHHIG